MTGVVISWSHGRVVTVQDWRWIPDGSLDTEIVVNRFINLFPFTQGTSDPTRRVVDPEPEKIALLQNPDIPR